MELARRLGRGEEVLLGTVVRTDGEPPSRPGAKVLASRDAALAGTLGCAEFDAAALADAPALLESGKTSIRAYAHELGTIEVYLEPYPAAPTLVVGGATPVARELLEMAPRVGFRTVLVETREERLAGAAWPAGAVAGRIEDLDASLGAELYFVHTDHDAPDLATILEAVLDRRPAFVGLMGSRRHTGPHLDALRSRGVAEERISSIETPVGLEIGAGSAPEIALSILAGIVAHRRSAPGGWKGQVTVR